MVSISGEIDVVLENAGCAQWMTPEVAFLSLFPLPVEITALSTSGFINKW
jgi:hypothetical protein